ncbi:MAG: phospho-N-acetylmuramoyl-pentapeptide-transferase [Bacillota bacterium]
MLNQSRCIRFNYRNRPIPSIGGIVYVPVMLTASAFAVITNMPGNMELIYIVFIISSMGIIGLLDDLTGNKQIKGIKNHIRSFLKGRLTTGFIKAFTGGLLALIISFSMPLTLMEAFIGFFIVLLFTNTMNLFDLRPGRSSKIFIVSASVLITVGIDKLQIITPLVLMLTAAAVYFFYDIKEKCMLGDVGSNIYGITLGYYSALLLDTYWKLILLSVLMFLNLLSEKKSLTEIIQRNRILSFLDNLGRG